MLNRTFVIYHDGYSWSGAAELVQRPWPFHKVSHAPIVHDTSAERVFGWLRHKYPDAVIRFDPALTERYLIRRMAVGA